MAADEARWAKAPEFADRPEVRARLREQTEADRREQLEGGMRAVRCRRCDACVLARKNSPKHVSIQWNTGAVRACEQFAAPSPCGSASALVDTCTDLRDSIDEAIGERHIEVGPYLRGDRDE